MADLAGVVKPSLNPSGFFLVPSPNAISFFFSLPWYLVPVTCYLFTSTHHLSFYCPSDSLISQCLETGTNTITTKDSIGTDGMCLCSHQQSLLFLLFHRLLLLLCSELVRVLHVHSKCGSLVPPCNHQSPFFSFLFFGLRSGGLLLLQHVLMVP